jgi:hypothetical protein
MYGKNNDTKTKTIIAPHEKKNINRKKTPPPPTCE